MPRLQDKVLTISMDNMKYKMDRLFACIATYCFLIFVLFFSLSQYNVGPYAAILLVSWLLLIFVAIIGKEITKRCIKIPEEPKPLRIVIKDYKRDITSQKDAKKENIQGNDGRNTETQEPQ